MSRQWNYRVNNEEFGPVVGEQIADLIRSQILTSTDQVRAENETSWIPLNAVDAFRAAINEQCSGDLEIPDSLDDLSFEFAETSLAGSASPRSQKTMMQDRSDALKDRGTVSGCDTAPEVLRPRTAVGAKTQAKNEEDRNELAARRGRLVPGETPEKESVIAGTARQLSSPDSNEPAAARDRKRVKRRSAEPRDPLMEEIIRELSERGSAAPTSREAAIPPVAKTAAAVAMTESSTATLRLPVEGQSLSELNAPSATSKPVMTSRPPAAIRPMPKPVARSFQMPEPKTIGLVAGGFASGLLVTAIMLGWVSVPFGSSGGALTGDAGTVVSCYLEFKLFGNAMPAGPEWAAFRSKVESSIKPVVETNVDANDNVTVAARKLLELSTLQPSGNPVKFQEIGRELETLIAGIVGEKS